MNSLLADDFGRAAPVALTPMRRRELLTGSLALAAMSLVGSRTSAQAKDAKDYVFAAALGWTDYDSGRHLQNGYKDAIATLGGNLTVSDAGGDPKRQSDQIDALISSKPDALFVTPTDAAALAPAVSRAIQARIPVFAADSMVPGVAVNTTVMSNNFGMGAYTAEFIAKRLEGKGQIAVVALPQNESWDQRTAGMHFALSQYPEIEIVGTFAFTSTGAVTPRQAVDNLLTAHPNLSAVWCAWDGAAIQGALAVRAARRPVFLTGIDGGKQAFEYIKSDTAMVLTMAQSFYEMTYLTALYAHKFLAGEKVPRLAVSPVYAVTKPVLDKVRELPDNYDIPGRAAKLGWDRVL